MTWQAAAGPTRASWTRLCLSRHVCVHVSVQRPEHFSDECACVGANAPSRRRYSTISSLAGPDDVASNMVDVASNVGVVERLCLIRHVPWSSPMKSIGRNSSKNEAAGAPAKRGTAGGGLCLTSRPAGRGTRMSGAGPDMSSAMSRCTGQIRPDVQMRYLSVLQSLFAILHSMCSKLRRSGRVALSWKTRRGPGSVLKASTKWRSTSLSINDMPCNRPARPSARALQVSS